MSCCGALYFRRRSKPPRKYRLRPLASSKQALRGPHFSVTGGGRVARQTLTCGSSPTCIKNMGYPVRVSHILVPVAGLEPARCRQRWILSPLRLPIPSHRQVCYIDNQLLLAIFYVVAAIRRRIVAIVCGTRQHPCCWRSCVFCRPLPLAQFAPPASGSAHFAPHHTGRCFSIIHHSFQNSKSYFKLFGADTLQLRKF